MKKARNTTVLRCLIAVMCISVCGCVHRGEIRQLAEVAGERIYIEGVPFFEQVGATCGASALASVMNYYDYNISAEVIAEQLYNPRKKGILTMDLLVFAHQHGFKSSVFQGSLDKIEQYLRQGKPLIILLKLTDIPESPIRLFSLQDEYHFIVVTGIFPDDGALICHSGKGQDIVVPRSVYYKPWAATDLAIFLVFPEVEEDLLMIQTLLEQGNFSDNLRQMFRDQSDFTFTLLVSKTSK